MTPTAALERRSQGLASAPAARTYEGEVVYLFAFDLAYDLATDGLAELLGQPLEHFVVDAGKRSPRSNPVYRSSMIRLPPETRPGPLGQVQIQRSIKLLPVSAVSITVRLPFAVDSISDLVNFHDLKFTNVSLHDEVCELARELRRELLPRLIRPHPEPSEEEAYTVFCIHSPLRDGRGQPLSAEAWLQTSRREVAALLTQEPELGQLSRQETDESTVRYLSYYERDLVVIDWDAALIIDEPAHIDEPLYVMELANFQLTELEAYDRLLDQVLDRAYRDLRGQPLRPRSGIMRDLREIRIDLARFSEGLSNTTKFFGDWHLARIYQAVAQRFHLADWHRSLEEKLKTLDSLYEMLNYDQTNRWMLILEATIVLLFLVDLILIFAGGK